MKNNKSKTSCKQDFTQNAKNNCHPEFTSESQPFKKVEERLKQVQHDGMMKATRAFTLIELLVVVLIIGILAAVAVPQYQKAVLKSRFSTIKALTKSLAQAEEVYYLTNASYTTDVNNLDIDVPAPDRSSISGEYGNYYYPWGYCQIENITGTVEKVACRLKKDGKDFLGYTQYLNHSQRVPGQMTCVAYHQSGETDTLQHRLCKSETGQQNRATDHNLSNSTMSTYKY